MSRRRQAELGPRSTPQWDPIPYELRIGVTGHVMLSHPVEVERAIRASLEKVVTAMREASADPLGPHGSPQSASDRLDRRVSHVLSWISRVLGPPMDVVAGALSTTWRWPRVPVSPARPTPAQQTPLKLTVISCLAKGADQIVARVVCDMVTEKTARNRYLEAVLPFPADRYAAGFESSEDREEFRRLLRLDRGNLNTQLTPTVLYPDFVDGDQTAGSMSRADAYAAAGRHVVNTSEMIVAVWDHRRDEHAGGTAETVRYAIAQGRTVLWLDPEDLDRGAALLRFESVADEALAPDEGAPKGIAAGSFCIHSGEHRFRAEPLPDRAKSLSRNFHRLAAYNRDGVVELSSLTERWNEKARDLRALFEKHHLPDSATDAVVNVLLPHYARADHAAGRYHALRDFAARLWPVAAALVVSLMGFQIVFYPGLHRLAVVELIVLVLGYLSSRVSVHDAWHAKWLNDRRLAEGLRAAMFSALLPRSNDALLAHSRRGPILNAPGGIQNPLPFYSPATAWFVDSLKRMIAKERRRFAADLTLQDPHQRESVAGLLREAWVDVQREHHENNAAKQARLSARAGRMRLTMILVLIAVAIAHASGVGHSEQSGIWPLKRIDLWVGFLSVALPAWAAAFHVMLSLDDRERLADRSSQMAHLLGGLSDELQQPSTLERLRETVTEAEHVMDFESAEWAESMIGRKPEFTG